MDDIDVLFKKTENEWYKKAGIPNNCKHCKSSLLRSPCPYKEDRKKCIHVHFNNNCKSTTKFLIQQLNLYKFGKMKAKTPDSIKHFENINRMHFICGNCINYLIQCVSIEEIINITEQNIYFPEDPLRTEEEWKNPHWSNFPQFALIVLWSQLLNYWPIRRKVLLSRKYESRFEWILKLYANIMDRWDYSYGTQYFLNTCQSIIDSIWIIIKYFNLKQLMSFCIIYRDHDECARHNTFIGEWQNIGCAIKHRLKKITNDPNIQIKFEKMGKFPPGLIWRKRKGITCSYGQCQRIYTSKHPLKLCKWCQMTFYCNKKCQKRHWQYHKKYCSKLRKIWL